MNNFNYTKKYKSVLHFIILALPLLLLLFSLISYNSQFSNILTIVTDFFNDMIQLDINNWYLVVINAFNFDLSNEITLILLGYVLFAFWYYLFYLLVVILTFVPKLCIKFINKFRGD